MLSHNELILGLFIGLLVGFVLGALITFMVLIVTRREINAYDSIRSTTHDSQDDEINQQF